MLIYILYLLIGLIGIGFVLFLHELGHFTAARLMKVDVEVLSYGMGPKLISIYGRNTEYRLSAIPFGGYCRMKGSLDLMKALKDDARSMGATEAGSYFGTTAASRFIIYLAGPLTNFILAIILLSVSAAIPVDRLSDPALVTPVSEYRSVFNSPIEQSTIRKGDRLIASGSRIFLDWQDAEGFLSAHSGEVIPVTLERDGSTVETVLIPYPSDTGYAYGITNLQESVVGRSASPDFLPGDRIIKADGREIEYTLDLYAIDKEDFTLEVERNGEILERSIEGGVLPFAWESGLRRSSESPPPIVYGITRSAGISAAMLKAMGAFLTLHLEDALTVLTGPVKAAESIGGITVLAFSTDAYSGFRTLLMLLSMVSLSIALGNLLPIPTFDGGQMLIAAIEALRRKHLSPRTYVILQIIGMIAALLIMVMMYSLDVKAYLFAE